MIHHRFPQRPQTVVERFSGEISRGLIVAENAEQMYSRQKGFYALLALTDVGSRVEYLDRRGQLAIANLAEVEEQQSPVYRYRPA